MFVVIPRWRARVATALFSVRIAACANLCDCVFVGMDVISVLNVNTLISCITLPTKCKSSNKMTCVMSHRNNRMGTEPNIPYWSLNS
jgi:hypothetical protein